MNTLSRQIVAAAAALVFGLGAAPFARSAEFHVHGLLELVGSGYGDAQDYNVQTRGDASFDPYGLRMFADAQVNPRLQVYSQFVLRDATEPYVDGAYLLFTPAPSRDLHVLAGKIPWLLGTYAPRTYSNKNPLIGTPLMYQYHTTLVWYEIPPDADALLATSGTGQFGVDYEGYTMGKGMALVDDSYWDIGVTLTGSERPLEYALGVTQGTPGWGSTSKDENSGKSVLGRLGLAPLPGVRLGVSAAYGPYLIHELNDEMPPGRNVNDYHQTIAMADLELLVDHFELRAEAARNVWQTPTVGDLEVTGGYVELKYALSSGAFLAGRWDALRFGEIADGTGKMRPWDSDVTRIEAGVGYRFDRDVVAKLVYQGTSLETVGALVTTTRSPSMMAAQVSIGF